MDSPVTHKDFSDDGYERKDVSSLKVVGYGIAGTLILIALLIFLIDFFAVTKEKIVYQATLKPESVALRELKARETEELNSYGLIDEAKGVYRIPIKRAMEIVAEEADGKRISGSP